MQIMVQTIEERLNYRKVSDMQCVWFVFLLVFLNVLPVLTAASETEKSEPESFIAPGAILEKLPGKFNFTEGPVADAQGNVYFSDYRNNRICIWSVEGKLTVLLDDSRGSVGLDIDRNGNIEAAEGAGSRGRLLPLA